MSTMIFCSHIPFFLRNLVSRCLFIPFFLLVETINFILNEINNEYGSTFLLGKLHMVLVVFFVSFFAPFVFVFFFSLPFDWNSFFFFQDKHSIYFLIAQE